MKKIILAFVTGLTIASATLGIYAHHNMIDMSKVVDVQATSTGVLIVTESGDGYYWEP